MQLQSIKQFLTMKDTVVKQVNKRKISTLNLFNCLLNILNKLNVSMAINLLEMLLNCMLKIQGKFG
jgi:hypothetical protein